MSESTPKAHISIKDMLNKAEDLSGDRVSHADHIRLSFADDEITFDFYRIESENAEPKAQRLHRVAVPIRIVRELGEYLRTTDAPAETNLGKLPDMILPEELDDKEAMWEAVEKLFATWDARGDNKDDIDDEWLDNLRAGWDERLKDIYDSDAGE